MTIKSLIKDIIPPLKISDTGERALAWMDEFRMRYLPVVKDWSYLGIVSESDLLGLSDATQPLEHYSLPLDRAFVFDSQHVYEAVNFVCRYNYPVVPVLDANEKYAGLVSVMDLIESFAELNAVKAEGGIIHLRINSRDYMLSQISQLVEANDASIISLSVLPSYDGATLDVTIKINRIDLTRILAAFNRYNYQVVEYYHQSEFSDDIQSRYDAFMNYLKI